MRVRPWPEIQRRSRLDAVLDERFSRLERCVLVQNGERLGLDSKLARGLAAYLQRKGRGRAVSCRVWWAGAMMRLSKLLVVVHLIRVREVQIEEHSDPRDARAAWRATHHEDLRAHLEAPGA